MVLSWYEQKAVCILLTLLHLGIRNIRLGPTLPAFLSPNVLQYLVEHYAIAPITTPRRTLPLFWKLSQKRSTRVMQVLQFFAESLQALKIPLPPRLLRSRRRRHACAWAYPSPCAAA